MASPPQARPGYRLGIDLGGTKIAAIVLGPADAIVAERRISTPRHDYRATLTAIADLITELTRQLPAPASVGIGMPGSLVPASGRVQNANSVWLNNQTLQRDLEDLTARTIRCANDANCLALSEAHDGAAQGCTSVFGVILGTGCGGGIVIDGKLLNGPRNIAGEWGHNPLPWPAPDETPGPACWCSRHGCMETWVSGPAIAADHHRHTGRKLTAEEVVTAAAASDHDAQATLHRHASRLARGLAHVINILDPEVIVLGGGLSALPHLYRDLPALIAPYLFAADTAVDIRAPKWGDASGVRGAARLWQT